MPIQLTTIATGLVGELGVTVQTSVDQEPRNGNVLFAARQSTMHLPFCSVCSNCVHIACPIISNISPAQLARDVKVGVGKFNFEMVLQSISELWPISWLSEPLNCKKKKLKKN